MRFADYLYKARQDQGKTQAEIAQATHISPQYLSEIERGYRVPSLVTVIRLGTALSLDIDVLCYYAGILPPDFPWQDVDDETIKRGFAAMRRVLREGQP